MSSVLYDLTPGNIAMITLNRPERLNAVNPELIAHLVEALRRAGADEASAVILRGAGRSFCAGHDLKAHDPAITAAQVRSDVHQIQEVTRLVRRLACPVIASVQGFALGAGCEIALCSDLVVAAESGTFGFPEVGVGLSVTGGISHVLPHAVGFAKAKELIMLGRRFSARQAHGWGLVNDVVAEGDLESATMSMAQDLASKPRLALGVAKEVLDNGPGGSMESALLIEVLHARLAMGSADASTAASAFRERGN